MTVVVIGAGVVGLSSALRLQRAGLSVVVLARDLPHPTETADPTASVDYASLWGGAHNRFVPPNPHVHDPVTARDHALSAATFSHMAATAHADPSAGVTLLRAVEYLEKPGPEYLALDEARAAELAIPGFRRLATNELPQGVVWGCAYDSWCVNPMVYCSWLLRQVVVQGGKVQRQELQSVDEVWSMPGLGNAEAVVNCSGRGFRDPDAYIIRGQTCLVAEPCAETVTRQNADGSWTFCVPRAFHGGTVIGGTKQPDDWTVEPSPAVRDELLSKFVATHPAILADGKTGLTVVSDIVGRRPARRGGMRLERETVDADKNRGVVHAYGLGGRGFELSWGVAGEVVRLVEEIGKARGG